MVVAGGFLVVFGGARVVTAFFVVRAFFVVTGRFVVTGLRVVTILRVVTGFLGATGFLIKPPLCGRFLRVKKDWKPIFTYSSE